jgi:multiple sugar transport system substrate-binding protein
MKQSKVSIVILCVLSLLVLGALPVAAQDEPVRVVWFVGLGAGGQPQQIDAQNQVVADFNAMQDEIELEIQIVDNNVAADTLATLIASDQAPDIVGPVGFDGSNAFAGNYADLTPYIEASGYDLSQFDPAAVANYFVEGEGQIGLPFATFPSFIYYRPALFDEAGIPYPPSNYGEPYVTVDGEEVPWDSAAVRDLGMYLSVDANGSDATMEEFDPEQQVQWGFVDQWNEPRGESSIFGGNSVVNAEGDAELSQAWTDAFHWFYNGIWEDHFIPNAAQDGSDTLAAGNAFSSGNVAMARSHLWYTCCLGDAGEWEIAPMFAHNGVVTAKLHGDTFRILKQSKNPEAAFEVLTYLIGDAAPTLLQVYGGMPARASETEAFFATLAETYPFVENWHIVGESIQYAENPNHESFMPNYLKAKDRIGAFQTLYRGTPGLDIDAELATLEADLQAIFDEVAEEE